MHPWFPIRNKIDGLRVIVLKWETNLHRVAQIARICPVFAI